MPLDEDASPKELYPFVGLKFEGERIAILENEDENKMFSQQPLFGKNYQPFGYGWWSDSV